MQDYFVVIEGKMRGRADFCSVKGNSVVIDGVLFDLSQVEVGCPCFWCGAIRLYSDLIKSLGEEEYVCPSCYNDYFYQCEICEKDWHKDHIVSVHGHYYCLDCTWLAD